MYTFTIYSIDNGSKTSTPIGRTPPGGGPTETIHNVTWADGLIWAAMRQPGLSEGKYICVAVREEYSAVSEPIQGVWAFTVERPTQLTVRAGV